MNKPFFYFEKLDWWDIITISAYSALTIIIAFFSELFSYNKDFFFFYSFCTPLFLITMNYISMRKFNVFLFWIIISIMHIYIYLKFKNEFFIQMKRGSAISPLNTTWIYLLIFQFCRFYSLHFREKEFIAPNGYSKYDIFDERKVENDDIIIFFFQMAIFFVLIILKTE